MPRRMDGQIKEQKEERKEGKKRGRERKIGKEKAKNYSKFLLSLTFHTNSSAYLLNSNSKVYLNPLISPCKLSVL